MFWSCAPAMSSSSPGPAREPAPCRLSSRRLQDGFPLGQPATWRRQRVLARRRGVRACCPRPAPRTARTRSADQAPRQPAAGTPRRDRLAPAQPAGHRPGPRGQTPRRIGRYPSVPFRGGVRSRGRNRATRCLLGPGPAPSAQPRRQPSAQPSPSPDRARPGALACPSPGVRRRRRPRQSWLERSAVSSASASAGEPKASTAVLGCPDVTRNVDGASYPNQWSSCRVRPSDSWPRSSQSR